jgi:quercetin dioxygenase-like cupin family protein
MNTRFGSAVSPEEPEQAELNGLLYSAVAPVRPPAATQRSLRTDFMARIARSVAEHAGLLTVRQHDGVWQSLRPGVRFKPLWAGAEGHTVLIEFAAGGSLPVHRHRWVEEGIVLRGGLQMGELELGPFDYHVSPAGSRHDAIRSRDGALAYLRGTSLGDTPSVVRELLGGLLPFRGGSPRSVFAHDTSGWTALRPGVMKRELWSDDRIASRFYRLEPGAEVPAHEHPRDEECMMLSGEVFLGDILLREGDYHFAPAASRHGAVYSDVGALLYVRAAQDCQL